MEQYRLSRTFFMGLKEGVKNQMIFHKKFTHPINVDKWKCLSHLRLNAFKCWKSPYSETCTNNLEKKSDCFDIEVTYENEVRVVSVPSFTFLTMNGDLIINEMIDSLSALVVKDVDYSLSRVNDNIFYFKIKKNTISFRFGKVYCMMFGFEPGKNYTADSSENIFFTPKSFRDSRNDVVGVSVNFGYNDTINYHEIIGILSCENVSIMNYFELDVINRPLYMNIKFESIQEIEVKFISLIDGQLLSFLPNIPEQELFVSMAFSEI